MADYITDETDYYVDCLGCAHWPDSRAFTEVCKRCNNTRQTVNPKKVLCNRCAGPQRPLGTMNEQYPHGLESVSASGGYDSYHLLDMTTYTFSICEKCLRELFNQFVIKPTVIENMRGSDKPADLWAEDQKYYEYRVWKDNGGHHQAYLNRKCNFEKDCPNDAKYTQLISGDFTEDCSCEEHKDMWGYGNSSLTGFIPEELKAFI